MEISVCHLKCTMNKNKNDFLWNAKTSGLRLWDFEVERHSKIVNSVSLKSGDKIVNHITDVCSYLLKTMLTARLSLACLRTQNGLINLNVNKTMLYAHSFFFCFTIKSILYNIWEPLELEGYISRRFIRTGEEDNS